MDGVRAISTWGNTEETLVADQLGHTPVGGRQDYFERPASLQHLPFVDDGKLVTEGLCFGEGMSYEYPDPVALIGHLDGELAEVLASRKVDS
jgi:hypothetical protein